MDKEFSILGNRGKLINDHFQNFKTYGIPHAQLIIADPPYNSNFDSQLRFEEE